MIRILRRRSVVSLIIATGAFLTILGVQLSPYFSQEIGEDVLRSEQYSNFTARVDAASSSGTELRETLIVGINYITNASITSYPKVKPESGVMVFDGNVLDRRVTINFEGLILFVGASILTLLSLSLLLMNQGEEGRYKSSASYSIKDDGENVEALSEREIINLGVSATEDHSMSLYRRATYVLVSGILMAFLGVGVFWAAFPDVTFPPDDVSVIYFQMIRAAGILIFIEAIAWFLLRQYRMLVEDHKWVFRQFMRRSNYLSAHSLAGNSAKQKIAIVASLLSEDQSGTVSKGNSTEVIEAAKVADHNPIFGLLEAIIKSTDDKQGK